MLVGSWIGSRAGRRPECRLGCGFRCWSGRGSAWSGRVWEGAETGEDLGEQVIAGW